MKDNKSHFWRVTFTWVVGARAKPTKKENDRAPPWDGTYLTGSSWEISFMEDLVSKRFPGTGISFEIHLSDGSPRVPGGHTRFPCRPACQSKDWEIVCPRPPGHPMGSSRTLSTSGSLRVNPSGNLRPSRPGSFPFKPLVPAHVTDLYGGNLSTA